MTVDRASSRFSRASISPAISRFLQYAPAITCAILTSLSACILVSRALTATLRDPSQCFSLLEDGGFWLDPSPTLEATGYYNRWQPQSCVLHNYTWQDIETCMPNGKIAYGGDSTIMGPYIQLVNWYTNHWDLFHDRLGPLALTHQSFGFPLGQMDIRGFWDPYLSYGVEEYWYTQMAEGEIPNKYNSSAEHELAALQGSALSQIESPPDLMLIGTGLWELQEQDGNMTATIEEWDEKFGPWLDRLDILDESTDVKVNPSLTPHPPGLFLINPIQQPDENKVERYRSWLSLKGTRTMNAWLKARKIASGGLVVFSFTAMTPYQAAMIETSGHHANDEVNQGKNNLLMNWRCNQVLSDLGALPITTNGLCCVRPKVGPFFQWALGFASFALLAIAAALYLRSSHEHLESWSSGWTARVAKATDRMNGRALLEKIESYPILAEVIPYLLVAMLSLLADRTFFLATHQKYFSFRLYLLYNVMIVLVMLFTQIRCEDAGTESTLLKTVCTRRHTDEWKGWMTLALCGIEYFDPLPSHSLQAYYNFHAASFVFLFAMANTNYLLTSKRPRPLLHRLVRLNLLPAILALLLPSTGSNAVFCSSLMLTACLALFEILLYIHRTKGSTLVYASIPPLASFISILLLHIFTPIFRIAMRPIELAITASFPSFDVSETFTCCTILLYLGHLAGFIVQPASRSPTASRPRAGGMDMYRAGALFLSALFVLFVLLVMPPHLALRRTWVPGFANLDIPTIRPTLLTTLIPATAAVAYPLVRATRPLRNLHSPLLAAVGSVAFEIFALRQHLWLGADGSGLTRLALLDPWLPAGPIGRRVVFFSRAFDMVVLGALVFGLAKWVRSVQNEGIIDAGVACWEWARNKVGNRTVGHGEEIEVENLLANGNGHVNGNGNGIGNGDARKHKDHDDDV